ncbi:O-antigen polymerase [Enterobacter hormaechei]|uniref:O-antigen polymerase n=1 Tax=Enterobacter hormaechei TaxID=158836 RepID=UPI0018685AAC|nr:O-antigen polymerase [Enterobacter hormaechei]
MAALNGDLLQAARLRQSVQLKENAIDIPYIGAVFKSFSVVCVYYYFIEFMKSNRRKLYFIVSFLSCALCLTLDLQKAPIFLVFINLFFIYIYYKKINIKALFFLVFVIFLLTLSVVFITGSDNPINSLISIFDRVLFGQNQAMYYMFQYLSPDLNGFLYNFYFSSLTEASSIPPNMKVIEFIPYYFGNDTLVNVNTFIVGDAWAFFGIPGVILSPFLVAFIFFAQSWFFSYLKRFSYVIFTSVAISFFSFYPINRSLAEILTLKYFLHYLSFSVIPIIMVLGLVNLLSVRK